MKNLPLAIRIEKNRLASDSPFLVLLKITINPGAEETVIRLARNNEDVVYQGETWIAFPFDIEFGGESAKGELTFATLKVSNVTQALQPHIEEHGGGVGSRAEVIVINADHPSEDYSDLTLSFTCLACSTSSQWVTFRLGIKNMILQRYPLYRYNSDHCNWVSYYKGPECGYSGPLANTPCKGDIASCRARGNSSRFGGFIGLDRTAIRFA